MAAGAGDVVEKRSASARLVSRLAPSDAALGRAVRGVVRPLYRFGTPMRAGRAAPRARRRPGDPGRQPHLVLRHRRAHAVHPASGLLRRQGRVPRLVDDPSAVPGPRPHPDRTAAGTPGDGRARRRRRRVGAGAHVGHLPGGHPVARRSAAPRPHGRGPAGADDRRAGRAGRPGRHRSHPADRRASAPTVPARHDHASARRSIRPTTAGRRAVVASS